VVNIKLSSNEKIRAQSKTELAFAYNISLKTFRNWIKPFEQEIGKYRGKAYTPKQVETIRRLLGEP